MLALDANVLVRCILKDDQAQSELATALQNALQNNLDFPDALHVALMPTGCAFATFDKKLIAKLPESTHPA